MPLKLLIADDAPDVAKVVAYGARMIWPDSRMTIVASGAEALRAFAAEPADLVILDVELPPPDGFEVCRRIRASSRVPILMLTVHDTIADKVRGFEVGADDYLTKPFDSVELMARLRALVRRTSGAAAPSADAFVAGDLTVDFSTQEVRVRGELVRLTPMEYRLLEELIRHAGTTVPHRLLLERVWGSAWPANPDYLKVFVRRLRQKLGDEAEHPRWIQTEWGVGYRFSAG